jgi:hypothetical protein
MFAEIKKLFLSLVKSLSTLKDFVYLRSLQSSISYWTLCIKSPWATWNLGVWTPEINEKLKFSNMESSTFNYAWYSNLTT